MPAPLRCAGLHEGSQASASPEHPLRADDRIACDDIRAAVHEVHLASAALHHAGRLVVVLGEQPVQVAAVRDVVTSAPVPRHHIVRGFEHLGQGSGDGLLAKRREYMALELALPVQLDHPPLALANQQHGLVNLQQGRSC